jgi:HD-GYP domain-containing protein (c-di-GMP phosphodiesterase class II)
MPFFETFESDQLVSIEVFRNLAAKADEFERYPNAHASRIAAIAEQIAKSFNLGARDRLTLKVAALGHDLGEEAMGREYIQRAGPLSAEERLDLARHPLLGEREAATAGATRGAQLLIRWHHEWWNGSGYPDGLRFEQIPLGARILRLADSYAALTDARPWRNAYSECQAREHILEWTGLEFDPQVVRAALALEPFPELNSFALRKPEPDLALTANQDVVRTEKVASEIS